LDEGLVLAEIIPRHPRRGEPFLKMAAYLASVELGESPDRFNSFCFPRHDKASYAIIDDLRHRAGPEGNDGRSASHGFNHDETERFWPISNAAAFARNCCFVLSLTSPES
jgi:hypothetical protein